MLAPALTRRWIAFAILGAAVVVAALSRHVLYIPFAHLTEPPMIVAGFVVVAWAALAWRGRAERLAHLRAEAQGLAAAAARFGGVEAWLHSNAPGEELEAEALRRTVIDRHTAMVAAVRAFLAGREPHDEPVVAAMTRDNERKGRRGATLLLHLATLQREALAEAHRRGFFGEARLLALDEALFTLSTVQPLAAAAVTPAERVLAATNTVYAALLVLGASHRLTTTFAGAVAGFALIAFEAFASAPIGAQDDPRGEALATW